MSAEASVGMKDSELRGIVLRKFYERRRENREISLQAEDFKDVKQDLDWPDIFRACDQLAEHGLIHWEPLRGNRGQTRTGVGRITAFGADVIEGNATSTIAVHVDNRTYAFHESHHNIIGDKNVQIGDVTVGDIVNKIDSAPVSAKDKKEARGIIARAFEQPAVANILAGIAEGVTRAFKG